MFTEFYIMLFQFLLGQQGYHWTEYAQCQFPEYGIECVISEDEMKVFNFVLDKANEGNVDYENRFFIK